MLGSLVGVVRSLVDCVEVTNMNEAELGVIFESGRGPDGGIVSLRFRGHHVRIRTQRDRANRTHA